MSKLQVVDLQKENLQDEKTYYGKRILKKKVEFEDKISFHLQVDWMDGGLSHLTCTQLEVNCQNTDVFHKI